MDAESWIIALTVYVLHEAGKYIHYVSVINLNDVHRWSLHMFINMTVSKLHDKMLHNLSMQKKKKESML